MAVAGLEAVVQHGPVIDAANRRPTLRFRMMLAGALLCLASAAPAQTGDVYLRCTTGPAQMVEPPLGEMPMRETLLLWVSGAEWREWSHRDGMWSNDLCAPRRTRCELTTNSFTRDALVPGDTDDVVRLERAIDRRSGSYFQRITTSGSMPRQVLEWEGDCREVERPAKDQPGSLSGE